MSGSPSRPARTARARSGPAGVPRRPEPPRRGGRRLRPRPRAPRPRAARSSAAATTTAASPLPHCRSTVSAGDVDGQPGVQRGDPGDVAAGSRAVAEHHLAARLGGELGQRGRAPARRGRRPSPRPARRPRCRSASAGPRRRRVPSVRLTAGNARPTGERPSSPDTGRPAPPGRPSPPAVTRERRQRGTTGAAGWARRSRRAGGRRERGGGRRRRCRTAASTAPARVRDDRPRPPRRRRPARSTASDVGRRDGRHRRSVTASDAARDEQPAVREHAAVTDGRRSRPGRGAAGRAGRRTRGRGTASAPRPRRRGPRRRRPGNGRRSSACAPHATNDSSAAP